MRMRIANPSKTPSKLRKKFQGRGWIAPRRRSQTEPEFNGENAETLVLQQGVGRGVVYAFCEMHNKCTKCTTDIPRNNPRVSKTARKMGAISTKGVTFQQANAGVNTTQKGSQESSQEGSQELLRAKVSEGARKIYEMISKDGSLRIKDMAEDIGVSTRMVMKYLKELEPLGVRHVGSTKKGRWVIVA